MTVTLKIPKERLRVLLADKKIIESIQKATNTKIEIDSETEDIDVIGQKEGSAYEEVRASEVIKAIGRGFVAKTAFRILEEDAVLVVVDVTHLVGKKKNTMERIKGRIIGTHGKSKQRIADMTNTDIVIYGKTVSIIGKIENALLAQRAVEALCSGAMHNTVFRMLEREAPKL